MSSLFSCLLFSGMKLTMFWKLVQRWTNDIVIIADVRHVVGIWWRSDTNFNKNKFLGGMRIPQLVKGCCVWEIFVPCRYHCWLLLQVEWEIWPVCFITFTMQPVNIWESSDFSRRNSHYIKPLSSCNLGPFAASLMPVITKPFGVRPDCSSCWSDF